MRLLALEVGAGQAGAVVELMRAAGFGSVRAERDLAGIERVVVGERGGVDTRGARVGESGGVGIDDERTGAERRRIDALRDCISAAGVVVFPADTVYGLGCDPDSEPAVRRLYELKGRPPHATGGGHVLRAGVGPTRAIRSSSRASAPRWKPCCRARSRCCCETAAHRYPLACGRGAGGSDETLGLRVPLLPARWPRSRALDRPVLQSSANLSGGPDARRLADVPASIRACADLVLDGGELPGLASTVLDLRDYERTRTLAHRARGPTARTERPASC